MGAFEAGSGEGRGREMTKLCAGLTMVGSEKLRGVRHQDSAPDCTVQAHQVFRGDSGTWPAQRFLSVLWNS